MQGLEQLAEELRETIIETVSSTGGHLASSLGVVELTLALHRIFESPKDKILWDVGHQAYAHKLLTGRLEGFKTLRKLGGLSGFPKRSESEHDAFGTGHASTSISAALGMVAARDIAGTDEKIVAVIGDGSLTGGLAFEALNHAGHLDKDLIVVLNDNEWSIGQNVGALSSFLSRKLTSKTAVRFKKETEHILGSFPGFGKELVALAKRAEDSLKTFFTPGMLFEGFGFDYFGPIDGHRMDVLLETFRNARHLDGPVLIHVVTRKGQGFEPAEEKPAQFHGVGPFCHLTGNVASSKGNAPSYTAVFGDTLTQLAREDDRVVAITAAMAEGTGLKKFSDEFPKRFFDVGIAEGHAVTFAAGQACQGLRPVVAVYSTFLQRAYDSIVSDVCLQNLPVTFALDRAGLVGADGPTHHGVFDLSFLRHIPNMVVSVPRDEQMLRRLMVTASQFDGPFMYRYPRGAAVGVPLEDPVRPLEIGKAEKLREGRDGTLIAVGMAVQEALVAAEELAAKGLQLAVVDATFVKPLDEEMLREEALKTGALIMVEENATQGGFGSAVLEFLSQEGLQPRTLLVALPDNFVEQGTQSQLRQISGIDAAAIVEKVSDFLHDRLPKASGAAS